jgi:glutamate racemase
MLACTCFPLVRPNLERLFPGVEFIDPGAYCVDLLAADGATGNGALAVEVTGEVVAPERVREFAASYLGDCCVLS